MKHADENDHVECECPSRRWYGLGQVHTEDCPNDDLGSRLAEVS